MYYQFKMPTVYFAHVYLRQKFKELLFDLGLYTISYPYFCILAYGNT